MPGLTPSHRTGIAAGLALLTLSIGASAAQTIPTAPPLTDQTIFSETSIFGLSEWQEQSRLNPQLLAQQQQPRTALVIGNADYPEDALANPVNDATDIAEALRSLGFEVTLVLDADLREMEEALDTFNRQLNRGGVGVFYYAGHGVQVEGENYLIPLTATLDRQNDVRYEAVPLGKVLNTMEDSEAQVKVVIIDACRDNPFYRRWRSGDRTLSSERGLAFEVPPEGTIISFATGPDDVAADGEGRNSPFTASLLQYIKTEGLDINVMFRQVRADVIQTTNGAQTPWYQESLVGSFSFKPAEPILISATTGIDYQPLRDALAVGDFRLADQTTATLMLRAADRSPERWFREEDLRDFSCEDLKIIDQLWLDYSDGELGFSVQQDIYQSLGGTSEYNHAIWERFADQVGWRIEGDWISVGFADAMRSLGLFKREGNLPHALFSFNRLGEVFVQAAVAEGAAEANVRTALGGSAYLQFLPSAETCRL
jgi:hypothetical protein